MGGIESRAQMLQRFNKVIPEKWELIRREGLTEIVVNSSGKEGELNTILLEPRKNIQEQQQIYYFRRTHEAPIVKCYAAEQIKQQSVGVCGVDKKLKVITERIVKRWGQLPQLSFSEILYCLAQALKGYKVLYEEVGPFEVTRNMIGINKFGNLRVWLNQNFADNNPSLQKKVLFSTESFEESTKEFDSERQMVKSIVQMIEEKCEEGKFPQSFREEIYKRTQSFSDGLEYINSYSESQKQLSPNKIHLENDKMYVSRLKKILITKAQEQKKNETKQIQIQKVDSQNLVGQTEIKVIQQKKGLHSLNNNSNIERSVIIRNLKGVAKEDVSKVKGQNSDEKAIIYSPSQNSYVNNDFRYNPNLTVAESSLCQISPPSPLPVSRYKLQFDHQTLQKKKLIEPLQIHNTEKQHLAGFTTSVYTNTAKPSNIKFNYVSSPIQGQTKIDKNHEFRTSPVRLGEHISSKFSNLKIQTSQVLKEF